MGNKPSGPRRDVPNSKKLRKAKKQVGPIGLAGRAEIRESLFAFFTNNLKLVIQHVFP